MSDDISDMTATDGVLTITDRELFDRLAWFTHVRWVFGSCALVALLVSWYAFGMRLRFHNGARTMTPAVQVVGLMFLYNAFFTLLGRVVRTRTRITRRLIDSLALGQFFCDLIAIAALIHYTGGVENAFFIIILIPVAIVTELLPQGLAYATATVAAALLNLLAWSEQQQWIPHVSVERAGGQALYADSVRVYTDPVYVLHVTAALTVTIFATVFVIATIAGRLRAREAELEDAHRKLCQADEAKGLFMRKAEHEMRAPLMAIHSVLDAVTAAGVQLNDDQRRLIDRARQRAKAMMALVNDLLKFSRLRGAEPPPALISVCLGRIVRDTAELLGAQAEAAGIRLTCRALPIGVDGDEELLRELVTNLVANAIQYTPRGGSIDVQLDEDGGCAVLTVADTGIGIDGKMTGRIFDEFYRTVEAKRVFANGTGLGLAIVSRIVEIHRGRIDAAARPEGGTVFTVHLPRPAARPPESGKR